jgi:hypothetical protein
MNSVVKSCGQHLKAPIALVRLRLYETLSLIPAQDFEGNLILVILFSTIGFREGLVCFLSFLMNNLSLQNKTKLYNYSFIYTYFKTVGLRIYIGRKSC